MSRSFMMLGACRVSFHRAFVYCACYVYFVWLSTRYHYSWHGTSKLLADVVLVAKTEKKKKQKEKERKKSYIHGKKRRRLGKLETLLFLSWKFLLHELSFVIEEKIRLLKCASYAAS
ncbi:uncharacterized protein LOC123987732 [Osmia bicornis bicornis]|uniref:uncharacterized protein LOC123987732 n=1 Tax=Osmia bicornis bicornis TaxID=1437191 RepID=UPI001EAEC607|nr:uncharacterized protein LOC123987732 [Osmia bicornis bicornis]